MWVVLELTWLNYLSFIQIWFISPKKIWPWLRSKVALFRIKMTFCIYILCCCFPFWSERPLCVLCVCVWRCVFNQACVFVMEHTALQWRHQRSPSNTGSPPAPGQRVHSLRAQRAAWPRIHSISFQGGALQRLCVWSGFHPFTRVLLFWADIQQHWI